MTPVAVNRRVSEKTTDTGRGKKRKREGLRNRENKRERNDGITTRSS